MQNASCCCSSEIYLTNLGPGKEHIILICKTLEEVKFLLFYVSVSADVLQQHQQPEPLPLSVPLRLQTLVVAA